MAARDIVKGPAAPSGDMGFVTISRLVAPGMPRINFPAFNTQPAVSPRHLQH